MKKYERKVKMKTKSYRKLLSFILTLGILTSIMSISAFAEESKDTQKSYYYSDNYFSKSSFNYSDELSTMSLDLELTTFSSNAQYMLNTMLEEIGFGNIVTNDLDVSATPETIGSGIGFKKLGDYNLIAVVIRGGNYEREWASNVLVGTQDNAYGFDSASKKVIERLKKYIQDNKLTKNKIWITGYLRGGAVADLTGVYINENLSEFNTTAEDLFVYTFEAPAGTTNNNNYKNIFGIVNINDPVPYLCPEQWSIYYNGNVINIGTPEKLLTYTQNGTYKKIEKQEFFKEFFSWFTSLMSREEYAENLEEPLSKDLDIFFSKTPKEREMIIGFIQETLSSSDKQERTLIMRLNMSLYSAFNKKHDSYNQDVADKVISLLDIVRNKDKQKIVSDEEYEVIKSSVFPIAKAIVPILAADYIYYKGIDYDEYYKEVNPHYNAADYDWGLDDGANDGKFKGYNDGVNPEITEMQMTPYITPLEYSDEYLKGYYEGFNSAYTDAFTLGKTHLSNNKARAAYDGEEEGSWEGYSDGYEGLKKSSKADAELYLEHKKDESWCTDEYKAIYIESFDTAYNKAYDEGIKEKLKDLEKKRKELPLYHTMTIYNNLSEIVSAHYPDVNLELLQMADPNYNSEIKRSDRYGDIDNDSNITSYDALMVLRNSVGLQELDENQIKLADIDRDNKITSLDSLMILRASVKIYDSPLFNS